MPQLNFKKYICNKLYTPAWEIACKQRSERSFDIIKNPLHGWAADPFIFEYNKQSYILAEVWTYSKAKGAIGIYSLEKPEQGWCIILEEPYHLSYPFIFEHNCKIYLCPECHESKTITLYESIDFPYVWKKLEPLYENIDVVDTTLFQNNNSIYGFTYEINRKELLLFELISDKGFKISFLKNNPIDTNLETARMAGAILAKNNNFIRVSQDCSKIYGGSLNFIKFQIGGQRYEEKILKKLGPQDIMINTNKEYIGMHTYNCSEKYEVIDLKYRHFNIEEFYFRIKRRILH